MLSSTHALFLSGTLTSQLSSFLLISHIIEIRESQKSKQSHWGITEVPR